MSLEKQTVNQQGASFCSLQSLRCALVAKYFKIVTRHIILLDPVLENSTSYIELVKEIGINLLTSTPYKKMVLVVGFMFAII